jgi:hypothetical protein
MGNNMKELGMIKATPKLRGQHGARYCVSITTSRVACRATSMAYCSQARLLLIGPRVHEQNSLEPMDMMPKFFQRQASKQRRYRRQYVPRRPEVQPNRNHAQLFPIRRPQAQERNYFGGEYRITCTSPPVRHCPHFYKCLVLLKHSWTPSQSDEHEQSLREYQDRCHCIP